MRMTILKNGIEVTVYIKKNLKKEKITFITKSAEEAYKIVDLMLS